LGLIGDTLVGDKGKSARKSPPFSERRSGAGGGILILGNETGMVVVTEGKSVAGLG